MNELREGPLHSAAEAGDAREVARLVAAGEDVNAADYRGVTPLHRAAGVGAAEAFAILLAAGADATALTVFRETPLHKVAGGRRPAAGRGTAGHRRPAPRRRVSDRRRGHVGAYRAVLSREHLDRAVVDRGTGGPVPLNQSRKYRIVWAEGAALLDG